MLTDKINLTVQVISPSSPDLYEISSYPGDGVYYNMTSSALAIVLDNMVACVYYCTLDQVTRLHVAAGEEKTTGGLSEEFVLKLMAVAQEPKMLTDAIDSKSSKQED